MRYEMLLLRPSIPLSWDSFIYLSIVADAAQLPKCIPNATYREISKLLIGNVEHSARSEFCIETAFASQFAYHHVNLCKTHLHNLTISPNDTQPTAM